MVRSGYWHNFGIARDSGTITKLSETTACRALANTRGEARLPKRKGSAITMTKDDIQLLYEFDRWANNRVLQAASTLSAEEFTRDLGGSFRSVRGTLGAIVPRGESLLTGWKEPCPGP